MIRSIHTRRILCGLITLLVIGGGATFFYFIFRPVFQENARIQKVQCHLDQKNLTKTPCDLWLANYTYTIHAENFTFPHVDKSPYYDDLHHSYQEQKLNSSIPCYFDPIYRSVVFQNPIYKVLVVISLFVGLIAIPAIGVFIACSCFKGCPVYDGRVHHLIDEESVPIIQESDLISSFQIAPPARSSTPPPPVTPPWSVNRLALATAENPGGFTSVYDHE